MARVLQRFLVLDALRAVLALCVAIGHVGVFPLFGLAGQTDPFWDLLARGFRTVVFGPPAVIAFFVISGFCIHYPFAGGARLPAARFYARRYVRILVPIVGVLALAKFLLPETEIVGAKSVIWHSTLWSLVCEEIYYAIYPLLFAVAPRVGWRNVVGAAFVASLATVWSVYPAVEWSDVGILRSAMILLPVWLLGCYLAETIGTLEAGVSAASIWLWRCAAWATMWMAMLLHFHSSIHQTASGVAVGVVCYFWLRAEIAHSARQAPWALLVWAGKWSYSLYLVHAFAFAVMLRYGLFDFDSRLGWLAGFGLILLASYGFYRLVERPSHLLARWKFPLDAQAGTDI